MHSLELDGLLALVGGAQKIPTTVPRNLKHCFSSLCAEKRRRRWNSGRAAGLGGRAGHSDRPREAREKVEHSRRDRRAPRNRTGPPSRPNHQRGNLRAISKRDSYLVT